MKVFSNPYVHHKSFSHAFVLSKVLELVSAEQILQITQSINLEENHTLHLLHV